MQLLYVVAIVVLDYYYDYNNNYYQDRSFKNDKQATILLVECFADRTRRTGYPASAPSRLEVAGLD